MPVEGQNRGSDRTLDVLGHPPVVLFVKVADGNQTGARGHCELVFVGRPLDASRSAINAQEHKRGLPLVGCRVKVPDIGISVLAARRDAVCFGRPVDARDQLVVLRI